MAEIEPIEHEVTVPLVPSGALALWTKDLGRWWPVEYTFSGEGLEAILIEPEEGGHCIELDRAGSEIVWGRVLELEADRRIVFSWEISPEREIEEGPEGASEVEIAVEPVGERGEGTRVTLTHRAFERHGEGAAEYREALAAEQGWPRLVRLYEASAATDS